jgi:rSAM/selenodomain-associated transferase 1
VTAAALLVIAKSPEPGRCKTRLCPPCTPAQAATLAAAALQDTLDVVDAVDAARKILVLDGAADRWQRRGWQIISQRGDGLAERLSNAFIDVDEPALLVGMDTPQLTPELLRDGQRALKDHDAVLGPASDGGYWSVGLRSGHRRAFIGVPMSSERTLRCQTERFNALGLRTHRQPQLRDVDTIADARLVATLAPDSRFARALRHVL